jgi:hypothetical protein
MSNSEYSVVVWDTEGHLVGWQLVTGGSHALRLADRALFRGREVRVKRRADPQHAQGGQSADLSPPRAR